MTNTYQQIHPAKSPYERPKADCLSPPESCRVGYVLKRYPRYSETFIVNEILAHERAGLEIEIFALRPPNDTHFQDAISRVRANVTYLPCDGVKAADFWRAIEDTSRKLPGLFQSLDAAVGAEAVEVFQAVMLANQAHSRGLTHLHAHFATSATTVARLAARFAKLPYSFTAHAKDIFHDSVRQSDLETKFADASAIVTVSDFNLDFLQHKFARVAARVERIYNGLDLERFCFRTPDDRSPLIVAVGRLVEKKGFCDLVQACAILKERGLQFSCSIVGTGPLQMELANQITRLDLKSQVELLGPRPQAEIISLVQEACVLAAPCVIAEDGNRDGLPTVLLEAMALGTPCVSTNVTGIPEIIRNDETGLLVPQRDPASLAEALTKIITSSQLSVRLATSARKLIETEFDVNHNAALLRRLFARQQVADVLKEVA
ncbi:MAG TPA: glycosyltransferase [Pyrinomonadaceae bacterium]